ncbi:unnamed protein product [Boreogadus saida]
MDKCPRWTRSCRELWWVLWLQVDRPETRSGTWPHCWSGGQAGRRALFSEGSLLLVWDRAPLLVWGPCWSGGHAVRRALFSEGSLLLVWDRAPLLVWGPCRSGALLLVWDRAPLLVRGHAAGLGPCCWSWTGPGYCRASGLMKTRGPKSGGPSPAGWSAGAALEAGVNRLQGAVSVVILYPSSTQHLIVQSPEQAC